MAKAGRIDVDKPTALPGGRDVVKDEDMTEQERSRLNASIGRGIEDGRAGREAELGAFLDVLDSER